MLYDTRGPLIKFESSNYRSSNYPQLN